MSGSDEPAPYRVLLIDPDDARAGLTRRLFSAVHAAHSVECLATYDEALRKLSSKPFDALIVSYRLGAKTAADLLRSETARTAQLPAIVLTSESGLAIEREVRAAGAVDCLLQQELTPRLLERALRYAVESHRTRALLEHRQAALLESEQVYYATFNEAPLGVAHVALDDRWIRINPRVCEKLGYSVSELQQLTFADLTHPDDLEATAIGREQLLSGATGRFTIEKRYRHANGQYVWMAISVALHRGSSGEPAYFIVMMQDVTARRLAEEQLDHLFNLSPDMISVADYDGYFLRTNRAWSRVLGWTPEELRAQPLIDFVHPDDRAATMEGRHRVLRGETLFGFTNRYRTRSGDYRWIEWHTRADRDSRKIYAVARDRTESRHLEEQLRQSQKMEAVGRLAGGVAHDFNNLLTVIIGFCELARAEIPADHPSGDHLDQIHQAAQSAASLTRQLLAFSRRQILAPQVFDLNALVLATDGLLRRVIGEHVEIAVDLTPEPCGVNADRGQIEQVLLNLAVNARDAMPGGGTLRIATAAVALDDAFVERHAGAQAGPHVQLTLADSGTGMPPEVLAHVFEPFFTTKEPGKGTGLGLATVYGIVRQSGGAIWIDSEPGTGTAVHVALPHVALHASAGVEPEPPRVEPARHSGTILLVEDQREVRRVIEQMLTRQGYAVESAAGGDEALRLMAVDGTRFDLVLTDVVMPQMNGRDLADAIRQRFPNVKVLFMSGYTDQEMAVQGVLDEGLDFIHKPFRPADLVARVRQLLDG